MPDITMCKGGDCPLKSRCYRYTASTSMYQFYFSTPPFLIDRGKFNCDMFWGDSSQLLFEQLKMIVGDAKKSTTPKPRFKVTRQSPKKNAKENKNRNRP